MRFSTVPALVFIATSLGCAGTTSGPTGNGDGSVGAADRLSTDLARPGGGDAAMACIVPPRGEFCPPVIYVSTSGDDFNNGMRPDQAVRTIPVGIARAQRCSGPPCPIVIAGGTYDGQVVLADDLSLYGGFTQDFSMRDPVAHEVIVTSSDPRT